MGLIMIPAGNVMVPISTTDPDTVHKFSAVSASGREMRVSIICPPGTGEAEALADVHRSKLSGAQVMSEQQTSRLDVALIALLAWMLIGGLGLVGLLGFGFIGGTRSSTINDAIGYVFGVVLIGMPVVPVLAYLLTFLWRQRA